jgi:cytochrome b
LAFLVDDLMNEATSNGTTDSVTQATRRVWDWPVRVFHWVLVLSVLAAYLTHRLGIEYFKYHVWCGYLVIVLVAFRIVWGLIGTRHARFHHFVRGPVTTIRYGIELLRGEYKPHAGHNPLGALMVLALLLSLLVQALTGLVANDEILNTGPLYAYVTPERRLELTSLHRQLFYWIVAFIVLHVLAVLFHLFFKKENLVHALLTGHKPAAHVADHEEIRSSRTVLALLVVIILAGVLAWVVANAPVATPAIDSFN